MPEVGSGVSQAIRPVADTPTAHARRLGNGPHPGKLTRGLAGVNVCCARTRDAVRAPPGPPAGAHPLAISAAPSSAAPRLALARMYLRRDNGCVWFPPDDLHM